MYYGVSVKNMYESLGPAGFAHKARQLLGLEDPATGAPRFDPDRGRNVLESASVKPASLSLQSLAFGILGVDAGAILHKGVKPHEAVDVLEAAGTAAVVPSTFANISAYNSVVSGMLEAKMLETYQKPSFIAEQLFEVIPTNKRSEKFIGTAGTGDTAEERKPGNRHPRIAMAERYSTTPETINHANGVDVTVEAAMFDLTQTVLKQAETASESVALRREYRCLDVFLGITNPYNYGGTSYNTYLTSGNWINLLQNPLFDWRDIDDALQLFAEMTDQENGDPIAIEVKDMFVMPRNFLHASGVLNYTGIERHTGSAAEVGIGANPIKGMLNLVGSPTYPYAYKRARASTGLNLSVANASGRWFCGDFKKAFGYNQNIPFTTETINGEGYESKDRRLILSVFCDEMGVPFVKDPRYVVCNAVESV